MRTCLLVSDVAPVRDAVADALAARGVECVDAGTVLDGFETVAGRLEGIVQESGPIDAAVIAFVGHRQRLERRKTGSRSSTSTRGSPTTSAETRPGSACSPSTRTTPGSRSGVVTITDATSAGGRSRAQASAQLSRPAHAATENRVDAFAIAVEAPDAAARASAAELAAHLLCTPDAALLSGAELVADAAWVGLRSHPAAAGTVTYGGPDIPDWLDAALRQVIND